MKIFSRFNHKGFTLIELLAVISIIAILAALGLVAYSRSQISARNGRLISDVQSTQSAMEQYFAQNGRYTTTAGGTTCGVITSYFSSGVVPTGVTVSSCTDTAYWACAQLEGDTPRRGANATSTAGAGYPTGTTHFCLRQLQ